VEAEAGVEVEVEHTRAVEWRAMQRDTGAVEREGQQGGISGGA